MTAGRALPEALVDANVLLRLFTGKPVPQARAARELVARVDTGELRLRLCPLVVAEVVWVLTSVYDPPVGEVGAILIEFLASGGLVIEEGVQVAAALRAIADQGVDFVDGYLAARARMAGLPVAGFDRDFDGLGVERLALGDAG
jgi:predicted nucleic acid-binding protein